MLRRVVEEPAAAQTGHWNHPGYVPHPLPAAHSGTCSHQSSPAFWAGVGSAGVKGRQESSLKAKVSLYIEKPPATQPDILGSAGPVGPPCGHRIPASKSLPASGWVNLVFEEGAWERDAGLVGLSWVSAVPPRPCWGDWNGSPGRGAAPRSAAGWAGTPGLPGLAQAPSANSLFLSSC